MKILLAGEESQAVCIEYRKRGHEAYSCDLLECSGGHPEWHIKGDVLEQLDKGWDMMIGFPTCTFMANSGVRWLFGTDEEKNKIRWNNLKLATEFFLKLYNCGIPKIGLENPVMHKYAKNLIGITQDQIIQPYHFGHLEKKATCLWLRNLPLLTETNNVYEKMMKLNYKDRAKIHYCSPGPDRSKIRSKTFTGIAKAMAEQWN